MEKEIMYLENLRGFIYAITDKERGHSSSTRTNIFITYLQLIRERIENILEVDRFLTKTELTKYDQDFLIPTARTIYEMALRFYSLFGIEISEEEFNVLLAWWRIQSDDKNRKFITNEDEQNYREIIKRAEDTIDKAEIYLSIKEKNKQTHLKLLKNSKLKELASTTLLFFETKDNMRIIIPQSITSSYDYIVQKIVSSNEKRYLIDSRFKNIFKYLSRFSHSSYDSVFNFALHAEEIETYNVQTILTAVINFSIVIVLTAAYNLFPNTNIEPYINRKFTLRDKWQLFYLKLKRKWTFVINI